MLACVSAWGHLASARRIRRDSLGSLCHLFAGWMRPAGILPPVVALFLKAPVWGLIRKPQGSVHPKGVGFLVNPDGLGGTENDRDLGKNGFP